MSSRDERRKFEGDVFYEAWRRGLDPDRATQCADDCYYDGRSPESCVDGYQHKVERARQQRREQEAMEEAEYYAEMEQRYSDSQQDHEAKP